MNLDQHMSQIHLEKFDFSDEIIDSFKERKTIPVHFYNKDGQVLIHKKEEATSEEIDRLLRFVKQGIYFDQAEIDKLSGKRPVRNVPEGLTDTLLLSEQIAEELTVDTSEIFYELKKTSLTSVHAKRASNRLASVFNEFENQADRMTGLVNIVDLMSGKNAGPEVELAVKRTVVAMAMKTRGMVAQSQSDQQQISDSLQNLMMASLFCDIGLYKMKLPEQTGLTSEQMSIIRNHPILSYLMLAHQPDINYAVKRIILMHHSPLKQGVPGNNYPTHRMIFNKLAGLFEKYSADPARAGIAKDIGVQLAYLKRDLAYDEDANILAIASEFASLTSKVAWREPFEASQAVKMIVNNSYFTYPERIIREFLDHVSISLCDNEKVIKERDLVILAARSSKGETYFEAAMVNEVDRYQSKPDVLRLGYIKPSYQKEPKFRFMKFSVDSLTVDNRKAQYFLKKDDTRRIVYILDPEQDAELYEKLTELRYK